MASAHDGQNELLHKEEKGFCLAVNENKIIHNIKKYKLLFIIFFFWKITFYFMLVVVLHAHMQVNNISPVLEYL